MRQRVDIHMLSAQRLGTASPPIAKVPLGKPNTGVTGGVSALSACGCLVITYRMVMCTGAEFLMLIPSGRCSHGVTSSRCLCSRRSNSCTQGAPCIHNRCSVAQAQQFLNCPGNSAWRAMICIACVGTEWTRPAGHSCCTQANEPRCKTRVRLTRVWPHTHAVARRFTHGRLQAPEATSRDVTRPHEYCLSP